MRRILVVSVGLLLLLGCSSKRNKGGVVRGKVTYKGQVLNGGAIMLHPVSGQGEPFNIPVALEGTFSSSDVPPGQYKVVVAGNSAKPPFSLEGIKDPAARAKAKEKLDAMNLPPPTIPFPDKYKDPNTTPETWTIEKGDQTKDLELKD